MTTDELEAFSEIPDPLRKRAAPASPPAPPLPSTPSPTRSQHARRRWLVALLGVGWIVALLALVLGLRADLFRSEVLLQLAVWTLGLPLGLFVALRPRRSGWPPGVIALRLGLVGLAAVFVGLAMIPMQGAEMPLTFQSVGTCLSFALVLALPSLIGAVLVLRNTFLNAPGLRGAVVGAVCGLAGAVGIHSHCPVVTWSHVLLAHGLPIVVFALIGAAFGIRRGRV